MDASDSQCAAVQGSAGSHYRSSAYFGDRQGVIPIPPQHGKAKEGARTDPYGVFQIRILKAVNKNTVLIENCADAGKREIQQVQVSLEKDLVHPLIRGRDVDRWTTAPKLYVLMVQNPETRTPIPEGVLKRDNPLSFSFLSHFKPDLLARGSGVLQAL